MARGTSPIAPWRAGSGLSRPGSHTPTCHPRTRCRTPGRNIAVARAEDAQEEGPARIHLREAEFGGSVVVALLLRHAPAQVDVDEVHPMRL